MSPSRLHCDQCDRIDAWGLMIAAAQQAEIGQMSRCNGRIHSNGRLVFHGKVWNPLRRFNKMFQSIVL
jgi:hypothetical protein